MYQLPELAKVQGLIHGFSTREKKTGEGNQRYGFSDPREDVARNRAMFLQKVCPRTPRGLFNMAVEMTANSTGHEEEIRIVRRKWDAGKGMIGTPGVPCEAMVTNTPDLLLYLTVGDCLPIVLFDPRRRVLALVHAGRESTIRRIPEKTLRVMREKFSTDPADVIAGMGPGFRSHTLKRLPARIANDSLWWIHCHPGERRIFVDLFGYNSDCIVAAGVPEENIKECQLDTYARGDLFFSHRRSTETGEPEGRHACAVGMLPE